MGNRDKLLAGARQSLNERGYARTTARDITSAANVSLAAIGYHFGTIENLLNEALKVSVESWGDELRAELAGLDHAVTPRDRFEQVWDRVIASIRDDRTLWTAQLEMLARAEHAEALRPPLLATLAAARAGLAEVFSGIDADAEPQEGRLLGSLHQALLMGMMVQWLFDPENALSAADLTTSVRRLAADLDPTTAPRRVETGPKSTR